MSCMYLLLEFCYCYLATGLSPPPTLTKGSSSFLKAQLRPSLLLDISVIALIRSDLFPLNSYLLLAVLGLRFCARSFSSCGERGPLFIAGRGPLTATASLVVEHRLQTRRLSSCGSRAQLLRGMWDLPRPGLEPVSPALAGGFSTTAPPGKPFPLNSYSGCCAYH